MQFSFMQDGKLSATKLSDAAKHFLEQTKTGEK